MIDWSPYPVTMRPCPSPNVCPPNRGQTCRTRLRSFNPSVPEKTSSPLWSQQIVMCVNHVSQISKVAGFLSPAILILSTLNESWQTIMIRTSRCCCVMAVLSIFKVIQGLKPIHVCKNCKGAPDFPEQVDTFLRRELAAGSVMGPFTTSPLEVETTVSPLNTVPKKDSVERRVIVDLSFPKYSPDGSINGGITKDAYLGDPIQLHYPSVDNLVNLIREKDPGCFLFKCDLSRAYRQLPVDPGDLHYLGYKWEGGLFINLTLTMCLRSMAYLCQCVPNAIAYIAKKNCVNVSNYLDDFGGVEVKGAASTAFLKLKKIIRESGH